MHRDRTRDIISTIPTVKRLEIKQKKINIYTFKNRVRSTNIASYLTKQKKNKCPYREICRLYLGMLFF